MSARRCAACRTTARSSTSQAHRQRATKVAVCEQMEDPKLCKGARIARYRAHHFPGTIMETSMLREGESNYLGAVMLRGKAGGCAFADVSTGEVCAASFETDAAMHIRTKFPASDHASACSRRRRCSAATSATRSKSGSAAAWSPLPGASTPKKRAQGHYQPIRRKCPGA